ncbi:ROK family transcriptional regulator [Streptomyces sp. PTM05]|uniref:ROK family transcriptional regulator n=1 Tax=Streptantibioticus parmotrematis TaxID=2873249 RepID=A0ABS7QTK0_9ACTN|nr:ROK family transcriptional regulator [Streptantibioticus parmotrematis]MBY8886524.1 ROK family transcriptional regulator [Streptantibioticus parmotrematis]
MNDRAALDLLLEHGPLSRTRIGELTGLSKPTASQLLGRLEAAGLVVATGTTAGRPGPSAQLYRVNPDAGHVAALDVTPDRITAAVADIAGDVRGEHTVTTRGRGTTRTVGHVTEAIDTAATAAGVERARLNRVVIGFPGAFDPVTNVLRYAGHVPGWHSPDLLGELAAALGVPVAVENDVNLAAVAEQRLGAAVGCEDFVLFWAEEGIGAAVVLGGRLHRGATGGAGEVGYMPLPGAPVLHNVSRANTGGFQELAGGEAVLKLARQSGIKARTPQEAIAKAVADGEDGAAVLDELAVRMATGLASVVAVLDPQLVVLSGGVVAAGGEELRSRVEQRLRELAIPQPALRLSELTGNPVLVGAVQRALSAARDEIFDTTAE